MFVVLVISVVVVALYILGVFNPTSPVQSYVSGFPGFTLSPYECITNVGMLFQLSNYLGQSVLVNNISFQPNGKTVWESVNFMMAPDSSQVVFILGACPATSNTYFNLPGKISYVPLGSVFKATTFSSGQIFSTKQISILDFLNGPYGYLLSSTYSFGNAYIGTPYHVYEYYTGAPILGQFASSFPTSLSDLDDGMQGCSGSPPYTTQGYTAVADRYIPGVAKFELFENDGMAVFYRNASGIPATWTPVMANTTIWGGHSGNSFGPVTISVTPGEYEIAVNWINPCEGGSSAISFGGPVYLQNGVVTSSASWNVTAWTPKNQNKSINNLPFQFVLDNPALPANISIEQWGTWSQSFFPSCGANNLCTTIFDDFYVPQNSSWWVDYDGTNTSSNNTFISFIVPAGNYSYQVSKAVAHLNGCAITYPSPGSGYLVAGLSTPLFYGSSTAENCSTIFSEQGLPNSVTWNITFDGKYKTTTTPANITIYENTGYGAYSFTAYKIKSGSTYQPCPISGNVAAGSHVNLTYYTSGSCTQNITTFSASGFTPYSSNGINWTVNYSNIIRSTGTYAISFEGPSGSHGYKIYNSSVTTLYSACSTPYYTTPETGTLAAGNLKTFSFSSSSTQNCTSQFQESGLPGGTRWNITYNGKNSSSLISSINLYKNQSDAKFKAYNITVSSIKYYPCPNNGVLPGGLIQDINFSTTFIAGCQVG